MKKLFYLLLLLLPFTLTSCEGDDEGSNPLVGHTFRYTAGNEYIQYTFYDGYFGKVCDVVVVTAVGSDKGDRINYDYVPSTKYVKVYGTNLLEGYYDKRTKSITDLNGYVYKRVEEDSGKIDGPDQATQVARELWSLMIKVNDNIENGYRYTNYEFSYGGGTVKITGQKADDSQGWTIAQFTEVELTNVSGFSGKLSYEDNNTHYARSTYSGEYYKRVMKLKSSGSGYPIRYKSENLEGSFSVDLYKDNSEKYAETTWIGTTLVDNKGRYADTSPVSGTLKADGGYSFSVTWR